MHETYRRRHGGLMRCCLLSLDDEMVRRQGDGKTLCPEGDLMHCEYCGCPMRVKEGSWEWASDLPHQKPSR